METKRLELIDSDVGSKAISLFKDIVLIISFALITGICAGIKIEIGPVPVTMQTFAVLLSGALLGSKRGALAQLTYLLMGLLGIFWFAHGGGLAYVLSPTFGYIIGFVLASYFVGLFSEKGMFALAIGDIIIYVPGLLYLSLFTGIEKALSIGLLPFIIGDVVKISLAGLILNIKNRLK